MARPVSPSLILAAAAVFFILGVAGASFEIALFLLIFCVLCVSLFFLSRFSGNWWLFFIIIVFLTAAIFSGSLFYHWRLHIFSVRNDTLVRQSTFSGIVVSDPRFVSGSSDTVFFDVLESKVPARMTVFLPAQSAFDFSYGDLVSFAGRPRAGSLPFDLPTIIPTSFSLTEHAAGNPLLIFLHRMKSSLVGVFERLLPPNEATLTAGMLTGWRDGFTPSFLQALRNTGTTHIVAVSGYNVTIVAVVLLSLTGFFFSRAVAAVTAIFGIILFIVFTGADPSAIRAGIMGAAAILLRISGRAISPARLVIFTLVAMVIWDPSLLVFNLGFQLSFLSFWGIICLAPALAGFFALSGAYHDISDLSIWTRVGVETAAAQLAVAPLLLFSFDSISLISVPVNILLLPVVPFAMGFSFVILVLAFVSFPLAYLFSLFFYPIIFYMTHLITLASSVAVQFHLFITSGTARIPVFLSVSFLALYYVFLFFFASVGRRLFLKKYLRP